MVKNTFTIKYQPAEGCAILRWWEHPCSQSGFVSKDADTTLETVSRDADAILKLRQEWQDYSIAINTEENPVRGDRAIIERPKIQFLLVC